MQSSASACLPPPVDFSVDLDVQGLGDFVTHLVEAEWMRPESLSLNCFALPDGEAFLKERLQATERYVQAQVARLESAGDPADLAGVAAARDAFLLVQGQAMQVLDAHKEIGLRMPVLQAESIEVHGATPQTLETLRRHAQDFKARLDAFEARPDLPESLLEAIEEARETGCRLHREALAQLSWHAAELCNVQLTRARRASDIPDAPKGAASQPLAWMDCAYAFVETAMSLDAGRARDASDQALVHVRKEIYEPAPGAPKYKSNNKARLKDRFDEELHRLLTIARLPSRPKHASPDEEMEAASRQAWHNCTDLARATAGFLKRKGIASTLVHLDTGHFGSHQLVVLNAAHHGSLDADMTRWPDDVWVCDPWSNVSCKAADYPQRFFEKMQKWQGQSKFVRDDHPRHRRWLHPMDRRWVEGVVQALRNLAPVVQSVENEPAGEPA